MIRDLAELVNEELRSVLHGVNSMVQEKIAGPGSPEYKRALEEFLFFCQSPEDPASAPVQTRIIKQYILLLFESLLNVFELAYEGIKDHPQRLQGVYSPHSLSLVNDFLRLRNKKLTDECDRLFHDKITVIAKSKQDKEQQGTSASSLEKQLLKARAAPNPPPEDDDKDFRRNFSAKAPEGLTFEKKEQELAGMRQEAFQLCSKMRTLTDLKAESFPRPRWRSISEHENKH